MLLKYCISEYKSEEKCSNLVLPYTTVQFIHCTTNCKTNFPENDTKNVRSQEQLFLICTMMHLNNEEGCTPYNLPLNDTV